MKRNNNNARSWKYILLTIKWKNITCSMCHGMKKKIYKFHLTSANSWNRSIITKYKLNTHDNYLRNSKRNAWNPFYTLEWPHRQGGCLACWSCKIDSLLSRDCTDLYYARGAQGYCPWRWERDQSIWYTVSDAIVRSWLWSTSTNSSPLGTSVDYRRTSFSGLLHVVDNSPHILW